MRSAVLALLLAVPALAQSAAFEPPQPKAGDTIAVTWSPSIAPAVQLGPPVVTVGPPPGYDSISYAGAHTVLIAVEAQAVSDAPMRSTALFRAFEPGTYDVTLQVRTGDAVQLFTLGSVSVNGPCFPEHTSVYTSYVESRGGYVLHLDDLESNSYPGAVGSLVIDGNHLIMRQTIYGSGIPIGVHCAQQAFDVGPLAPGAYRLTWVTDYVPLPVAASDTNGPPPETRELTFVVTAPHRRASRR
jgi:hypothetical protein